MKIVQRLTNKFCRCIDRENTIQFQKITINRSDLKLYLKEYNDAQKTKGSWHFPLTVFISLIIALATTDFQESVDIPFLGLPIGIPEGMRLVLWFVTVVVAIWTIYNLIRSAATKDPSDILLKKINSSVLNKPDRTSIFIIKRDRQNEIELLVEKKSSWASYFLPYVKQVALTEYTKNQEAGITKSLGDKLGVKAANIKIQLLQEFNFKSEKFDPPQKVVKEYHFEVFHVSIDEELPEDDFRVGDRNYFWKSLNDLESDESTKRNNKDIINHLRDNYNDLVLRVSAYDG